jgi:hypothetical protein
MRAAGAWLAVLAVALAAAGQALVARHPWVSCICFALGMLLFVLAEWRTPQEPEPEASPSLAPSWGLWAWLFPGCVACVAAGVAVYRNASPACTHGLWFLGLGFFIACTLWLSWRRRSRLKMPCARTIAAWVFLLTVSGVLFGWRLTSTPPEVHGDDAEVGNDAFVLLEMRPFNLFGTGWFELPRLHAVPTALGLKLFGPDLAGLRGTSVVLGMASVLLVFAVARRLWGFEVALLSGLLLASTRYFIHLSRTGFHYIDTPFLSLLVLWLFLRAWYDQRMGAAIWCGIALGLGVQTYYASRLVPVLLGLTWILWMARSGRDWRAARTWQFVVIVVVALATVAPMAGYFAGDWGALWLRTEQTSIFAPAAHRHLASGYGTDSLVRIFLIQLRAALALFNLRGDASEQYHYEGPMFDPVTGVLFVLGVAEFCASFRQRRSCLALLWLLGPVIVGGALTIDAPFYPRVSGAVPFAVLAAAFAMHRLLGVVRTLLPNRARPWVGRVAALCTMGLVVAINVRTYFWDYAPSRHLSPGVQIAEWVHRHGAGKTTYMVGGAPHYYIKHGTIRFLTHGYDTRDIVDPEGYLRSGRLDPATSLFVVMPRGVDLLPQLSEAVGPLDVEPQYYTDGRLDFYGVIPRVGAGGR